VQKSCPRCHVAKPLTPEFWARASGRASGFSPRCKLCDRARNRSNYEKTKAQRAEPDFEITVDDPVIDAVFAAPEKQSEPVRAHSVVDPEVSARLAGVTAKRYLVTAAQNATPIHQAFWETLQVAAKHLKAQILVVPLRYKNPTSQWTEKAIKHDWWAPELEGFLIDQRKVLHKHLVLAADVKTQPTASDPLSGFQSLTGPESCILGHMKMAFETVAVPSGRYPKILTTTGACTMPNYTDTKTGKVGEFHHYLGAVLVEIDGDRFHIRQINADKNDGSFIDWDWLYTCHGAYPAASALALQMGDIHARFVDPKVDEATFGKGGIVAQLRPYKLIWNDTLDGYSVNPHHLGNPFITQGKFKGKLGNVREEVIHAIDFVRQRTPPGTESIIVPSNHDDMLARWVIRADWKTDPVNARFYLQTALAMLESVQMTQAGTQYADPFVYWVEQLKGDANIRCLERGESLVIGDAECGLHGDKGPNGAKGSVRNLSRLGTKVNSNHGHAPAIREGHYRAGTSTGALEYTIGSPSGWLQTHIVTYANGARCLVTIIDGRFRLSEDE
jgi:hypothetical protein